MKNRSFILSVIILCTCWFNQSCQSKKIDDAPQTALETAQQFLRLEMKGEFTNASNHLLITDYNQTILSTHEKDYVAMPEEKKTKLNSAFINIISYDETSDSTAILDYSNAIDTKTQRLFLIRQNKKWLVDFKAPKISK